MTLTGVMRFLRPTDDGLSERTQWKIQVNRILSLLAVVAIPAFGLLRAYVDPEVADPMWPRLAVSGGLLTLLLASFWSTFVRRRYLTWMRGMMYAILLWFALLAGAKGFASNYAVGYLVIFTSLAAVIGYQTDRVGAVLSFSAFSALAMGGGVALGPPPQTSPVILLTMIGMITMVEAVVVHGWATLQEQIEEKEVRLRTITGNVSDGIFRSRPDDGVVYANQAFADMFGFSDPSAVAEAGSFPMCLEDDCRRRFEQTLKEDGCLDTVEADFRRRDGSTFTGLLSATVVRDEEGDVEYYDGAVTDISERKRYEEAILEERDRLETLFQSLPTPVVRCTVHPDGTLIEDVNPAFESTFGIDADEAVGEDIDQLLVPEGERERAEDIEQQALAQGTLQVEVERQTVDGMCSFQLQVQSRQRPDGSPEFYAIYTDASELKRRQEELEHEATHDALTGLPNRTVAREEIESLMEACEETLSAILYIDLDGFKQINDDLGHGTGDELLVTVAERLRSAVRASDLVARVGGDEFVVCVSDVGEAEVVYHIAERIDAALREPVDLGSVVVSTPASIGVVLGLSSYDSVEAAVQHADAAMYKAKEEAQKPYVAHESEDRASGTVAWESRMFA